MFTYYYYNYSSIKRTYYLPFISLHTAYLKSMISMNLKFHLDTFRSCKYHQFTYTKKWLDLYFYLYTHMHPLI